MRKIPTLFIRDERGRVLPEWNPEAAWVAGSDVIPTGKWDGTCCLVKGGVLYKRRQLREGQKVPGWVHWTFDPEQLSGHGWQPVGEGPEDKMHREALEKLPDGTYELCGPGVQKNPHGLIQLLLCPHGERGSEVEIDPLPDSPSEAMEILKAALEHIDWEGLVWHDDVNDRYAKIKRRDFGLPWPLPRSR